MRVLSGKQINRNGNVLHRGQTNHAQQLRIKKPQRTPTISRYLGRFNARTLLEKTSIVQVTKFVRASRISLPFVKSTITSLSVNSAMKMSDKPTTASPMAMVTDMQYREPVRIIFRIRPKFPAPKFWEIITPTATAMEEPTV